MSKCYLSSLDNWDAVSFTIRLLFIKEVWFVTYLTFKNVSYSLINENNKLFCLYLHSFFKMLLAHSLLAWFVILLDCGIISQDLSIFMFIPPKRNSVQKQVGWMCRLKFRGTRIWYFKISLSVFLMSWSKMSLSNVSVEAKHSHLIPFYTSWNIYTAIYWSKEALLYTESV